MLDETPLLDDLQVLQRDGGRDRMAGRGEAVAEGADLGDSSATGW